MPTIHEKVQAVRSDLKNCLLERDSAIDNALLALLTGNHFLQLGPAGSAKSLLVRAVHLRIEQTVYFEKLMSQFTVPEELFGPVDLLRYADHGEYKRLSKGALTEAHVVFLDECWKANSAILNSLLSIMNERLLHEVGFDPQRLPLLSLFGASNETPQDSALRALDDRFLLREVVEYIAEEANFVSLLTAPLDIENVQATLSLQELQQAQQAVLQVKGTPEVLHALLTLRQRLSAEGLLVSDRKWRQCVKLLKARAWLDGDSELDVENLTCLMHALWMEPKEFKTVQRVVYQVACPLYLRCLDVEDQAAEVLSKLPKEEDADFTAMAENTLQQLDNMIAAVIGNIKMSSAKRLDRPKASLMKICAMKDSVSRLMLRRVEQLSYTPSYA